MNHPGPKDLARLDQGHGDSKEVQLVTIIILPLSLVELLRVNLVQLLGTPEPPTIVTFTLILTVLTITILVLRLQPS